MFIFGSNYFNCVVNVALPKRLDSDFLSLNKNTYSIITNLQLIIYQPTASLKYLNIFKSSRKYRFTIRIIYLTFSA